MPTLWDRLGLWRVTRSRPARSLYDRLLAAGVRVARLDRLVRDADANTPDLELPASVDEIDAHPASQGVSTALAGEPLAPEDVIVTARREGRAVGYCLLSDRPVYVPELDRRLSFAGGYVWRVYVAPPDRGDGIGTALLTAALDVAGERFDAESVSALVAPDNVPSRRLFTSLGFTRREGYVTVGIGDRTITCGSPR